MVRGLLLLSGFLCVACTTSNDPADAGSGLIDALVQDGASIDVGGTLADAATTTTDSGAPVSVNEPHRIVILSHEFGFSREAIAAVAPEMSNSSSDWAVDLKAGDLSRSAVFKELEALHRETTLLTGLAVYPAIDGRGEDTTLQTALLTGFPTAKNSQMRNHALGPSLDFLISQSLGAAGGPLVTVSNGLDLSYGTDGARIASMGSAAGVFDALANASTGGCDFGARPVETNDSENRLVDRMSSLSDVIARAIACDRARVFSINMPRPSPAEFNLSFRPSGDLDQNYNDRVGVGGAEGDAAKAVMIESQRLAAKQVARLAEKLMAITSGSGTLLDQTLIVWLSNEGRPGHEAIPWSAVLVGGRGLGVKSGRVIHYPEERTLAASGNTPELRFGLPHNHLLVSLANLMGLKRTFIGNQQTLFADGKSYDLTGGLPNITQ